MSALVQEFLQTWESELLQLRSNDPLIDLTNAAFISTEAELWQHDTKGPQLLKEAKRIQRERNVLALVHYEGVLTWKKGDKVVRTPVFLKECTGIKAHQQLIEFEETAFLNPFLALELKKEWGIALQCYGQQELLSELLDTKIFTQFEPLSGIANLHPQRYELRKEWEALINTSSYSLALHQIIGDTAAVIENEPAPSIASQISPLDPDQRASVSHAAIASTVIYGPPGTGKSVVLSNIVAQALAKQQSVLIVSDKPVALDVLLGKLAEKELDQFCIFLQDSKTTVLFYKKLKQHFEQLLEVAGPTVQPLNTAFVSEKYWVQRKIIERQSTLKIHQLLKIFESTPTTRSKPSKRWQSWLVHQALLQKLSQTTRSILPYLQQYWQQTRPEDLQHDWQQWKTLKAQLNQAPHKVDTLNELDELIVQCLRCVQFQGGLNRAYATLLDQDPDIHLKQLQQYQHICAQQTLLLEAHQVWKQIPTLAEWAVLLNASKASGWLAKWNWYKLQKKWFRLSGVALTALDNNLKKYWRLHERKAQLVQKYATLGIFDLDTAQGVLIALLKQHHSSDWKWYRTLTTEAVQNYCQLHQIARRFKQLHCQLFSQQTPNLNQLEFEICNNLDALLDQFDLLMELPFELWDGTHDLVRFKQQINNEFWADLQCNFPALYNNDPLPVNKRIEQDLLIEDAAWQYNAKQLYKLQKKHFTDLQQLLVAPLNQLSEVQKQQRQALRKGKAILVREMAKTRQHMRLTELFESAAAPWLKAIFPIWLTTPTVLAKRLPMQIGLFDIGVFDEASQLPLSHAVGALQRVTKLVVAGDPQQMRPQSYFGQSDDGVVDLLHQAAFYLPSKHLRYHYRSENPDLIAFSNKHFYNNSLIVWPAKTNSNSGLFDHFIEDGCYEQQQNSKEAQAVAKQLKSLLPGALKIGVVAFSETQLNCIYQQLSNTEQALLERRIEERSAFFLALEQVQGEECDILIISFGYAKNTAQQFSLKLGPMTKAQSGRRLNVLLTRAQKALHFYSSIRASDFPAKRSTATHKLWEWFVFLEKSDIQQAAYNPEERLDSAADYLTFLNYYRVLKLRQMLGNQA